MESLSKPEELRTRAKQLAIRIIQLFRLLPKNPEARVIGNQVLRSGTSMAANYRAACRARSRAEFLAKIGTVVEETDETVFWLELLVETKILGPESVNGLLNEANQLLAIFSASQQTAKRKLGRRTTSQK